MTSERQELFTDLQAASKSGVHQPQMNNDIYASCGLFSMIPNLPLQHLYKVVGEQLPGHHLTYLPVDL